MVPVWLLVTWSQARNSYQKQRNQIPQILQLNVDSLDHTVERLKTELKELPGLMQKHQTDSPEAFAVSFDAVASEMRADSNWVQAYQINESGIVTHNFPVQGNQATMGVNILKHPDSDASGDLR